VILKYIDMQFIAEWFSSTLICSLLQSDSQYDA